MENNKIAGYLGLSAKAGKIVFGTDACIDAIKRKKINLLIIATDASERTKNRFEIICKDVKIPCVEWECIEKISKTIGKNNKAVVGIKDRNLSNAIFKIINGGESIG